LKAAKDAVQRQQFAGEDTQISYEIAEGVSQQESVKGGDRPDVDVEDDTKG